MPLIDTLTLKTGLLDGGMPEPQAAAIVRALADADVGQLATKSGLADLRADVRAEIADVRTEVEAVRADMRAEIADVRTEIAGVRTEVEAVRADMRAEIAGVRTEIAGVRTEVEAVRADTRAEIAGVRTEVEAVRADMRAEIAGVRTEIAGVRADTRAEIAGVRTEIEAVRGDFKALSGQGQSAAGLQHAVGACGACPALAGLLRGDELTPHPRAFLALFGSLFPSSFSSHQPPAAQRGVDTPPAQGRYASIPTVAGLGPLGITSVLARSAPMTKT